jgi:cell division protein FtsB
VARVSTTRAPASRARPAAKKPSAAEREQQRRGRLVLAGAVVLSALMLGLWFPFAPLLQQHRQIGQLNSQLSSLEAQDRQLAAQEKTLSSPSDVTRLAREQYQLVQPGQRLVQVLPPNSTPTQGNAGQAPYPGDPGLTGPVAPSAIALLPTTTTTTPGQASHGGHHASGGLLQRLISTLAFWRR